jgi:hypothetical protein
LLKGQFLAAEDEKPWGVDERWNEEEKNLNL